MHTVAACCRAWIVSTATHQPLPPALPKQQRVEAPQQRHHQLAVQQGEVLAGRGRGAAGLSQHRLHHPQALHPALHRLLLQAEGGGWGWGWGGGVGGWVRWGWEQGVALSAHQLGGALLRKPGPSGVLSPLKACSPAVQSSLRISWPWMLPVGTSRKNSRLHRPLPLPEAHLWRLEAPRRSLQRCWAGLLHPAAVALQLGLQVRRRPCCPQIRACRGGAGCRGCGAAGKKAAGGEGPLRDETPSPE